MFKFPSTNVTCHNSSSALEQICYNNGVCSSDPNTVWCTCNNKWNPLDFCSTTVYQSYGGSDIGLPIVFIPIMLLLLILYFLELGADIKTSGSRALLRTPGLAKIAVIFYCLIDLWYMIAWAVESATNNLVSSSYQTALYALFSISGVISGIGYMCCVLAWIDAIVRTKELGITEKVMKPIKITLYIVAFVLAPLSMAFTIWAQNTPSASLSAMAYAISGVIAVIVFAFVIILTTVFVIKIALWGRTLKEGGISDKLKRIFFKNKMMMVVNVCLIFELAIELVSLPNDLPAVFLLKTAYYQTIGVFNSLFILLFVENYLI